MKNARDLNTQGTADDPWETGVGGIINAEFAPVEEHAYLTAAANILFLHHLTGMEKDPRLAERMHIATGFIADAQLQALESSSLLPEHADLYGAPDLLRRAIHKRTPEKICLALLISALVNDPFDPYQIPVKESRRDKALARLAQDLGIPKTWSADARTAVKEARAAQTSKRKVVTGAFVAAAGLALAVLALPLATLMAPVGVAGGAALLSGLAALGGTTGVMGGIAVITTVGAVGGAAALGGALVAGSAKDVEMRVLLLHGTAAAKAKIRPGTRPVSELHTLEHMKTELETQLNRHNAVDVRAKLTRDLERKLETITSALDAMGREFPPSPKERMK